MASPGHPPPPSERGAIACPTSSGWNPYLDLLYGALEREGVPFEPDARLTAGWLVGARRRVRWLHIHWPQSLYRFSRGPRVLRGAISWLKLGVFSARLALARALGYRLVWTIHQVLPHEGASRLDVAAAHLLARRADVLVANDEETATRAAEIVGARQVAVVSARVLRRRLPARGREGGDESRAGDRRRAGRTLLRRAPRLQGRGRPPGRLRAGAGGRSPPGRRISEGRAPGGRARRGGGAGLPYPFSPDSSVTSAWPTSSPRLMSRSCRAGTEAHRAP